MRKILLIILFSGFFGGCKSQEKDERICYSPYIQSEFHYSDDFFLADSSYLQMLNTLSQVAGLHGILIPLYETYDYGSFAVFNLVNYQRSIWINKDFFKNVYDKTKSIYAPLSIIAHELAHHLYCHPLEYNPLYIQQELNADRYSGYLLRLAGTPKKEVSLALLNFADEAETTTHPDKLSRIKAVEQGWMEADLLITNSYLKYLMDSVQCMVKENIEVMSYNESLHTDTIITIEEDSKKPATISYIKLNYTKESLDIFDQNILIRNLKVGELSGTNNRFYRYTFSLYNEKYFIDINNLVWLENPSGDKIQTGIAY